MFSFIKKKYGDFELELEKLDPAWAKAALFFRSDCVWHLGHGDDEIRMQSLQAIWEQLEARRERFEKGQGVELLHAIKLCADENLPLPTWLALAFNDRFTSVLKPGGPLSLDSAFNSRLTSLTENKRKQFVRDWQIAGKIWVAVWEEINADESIVGKDPALQRAMEKHPEWGVGKTRALELLNIIDKSQMELMPSHKGISRFLHIRRKSF